MSVAERIDGYFKEHVRKESLVAARMVLEDLGITPVENAERMAEVGQPAFVVDYLVLALEAGEIEPLRAAEIMIQALENQTNLLEESGRIMHAVWDRNEMLKLVEITAGCYPDPRYKFDNFTPPVNRY